MTQLSLELASAILGKYITLTYNQFKTTLDHVWMSIDLYITGYGYRAFKSDHCGVFIHLKLHHCSNTPIQAGDKIKLSSKNPASVLKYLDDLKPKVNNHPLLKKVESLITKDQLEGTDAETLQSGDKFLTDMQLATEAALYSNKTIHCFLDKLHHMKFIWRYWRNILHLKKYSATHEFLTILNAEHNETNIQLPRNDILQRLSTVVRNRQEALTKQYSHRIEYLKKFSCLEPLNY